MLSSCGNDNLEPGAVRQILKFLNWGLNVNLVRIGYSKGPVNLNKIDIVTLIMNNEDQFCCLNKLKTSAESF